MCVATERSWRRFTTLPSLPLSWTSPRRTCLRLTADDAPISASWRRASGTRPTGSRCYWRRNSEQRAENANRKLPRRSSKVSVSNTKFFFIFWKNFHRKVLFGICIFNFVSLYFSLPGREYIGYQPKWFRKEKDPQTGNLIHIYTGEYWEAKETGDWSRCPDIYLWWSWSH